MNESAETNAMALTHESSLGRKRISATDIWFLFVKPRYFFTKVFDAIAPTGATYTAAFVVGMMTVIDRIDRAVAQEAIFDTPAKPAMNSGFLTESWLYFWTIVVLGGMISGLIYWFLGGWWYRKRLEFAGAEKVDPNVARSINVWQLLVMSLPAVLFTMFDTIAYRSYLAAYVESSQIGLVLAIFPFLSIWVSYTAATTAYSLKRWPGLAWFVLLPGILYVVLYLLVLVAALGWLK
jgi:hypothetical protein